MKKKLYSLLAILALLAMGSGNTWAQDVYEQLYTRSLTSWTSNDLTDWNALSNVVEINADYGLGANASQTATYVTKTFTTKTNAKVKYEVDWTFSTATGRTGNWNWIQFGDKLRIAINSTYDMQVSIDGGVTWNATALGNYRNGTYTKHISLVFDTQKKKVESFSFDDKDRTSLVAGTLGGSFNTVSTGFIRSGSVSWTLANYLTAITVSQAEQEEVETANYTVKYIYNNEVIKTVEGSEAIGTTISAESPITINGVKYYAVDGSNLSMELVDGTNVLEVTLREAETWSFTVNSNLGTTLATGSVVEGESEIVAYPQYVEVDGTLYTTSTRNPTGDGYYLYRVTPTANGEVVTINYTESVQDIVYFSEAEDIPGATANNGYNGNIRCSNAYGAFFEDDVTITTLPAGVYKVSAQVWGNSGVTFNILAGETTVLEAATVGYLNPYTSEEFTLTESTDIIIQAAGNNGKVLDWIYIQSIPATYNYTVVSNLATTITSGSVTAGESVTFAYPEYILSEGTLYRTSLRNATGDGYYLYTFTPAEDGEVFTIDYASSVQNVVYYSEAEDIDGATPNDRNNANIRCSNAFGALFGNDVTVTTLPAGIYKVTVQVWGNSGVTFNINAGDETVLEAPTVGYLNSYTSEEFVLTEETSIVIPAAGANGKVIDWIYIVRTGDAPAVVNIGPHGYATLYYEAYCLVVPPGVVAKTYSYAEGSSSLVENKVYEEGDLIPCGEAVVLQGEEGKYTFKCTVANTLHS